MRNLSNSLRNGKLVSFTVDSAEMQKLLSGLIEDFNNYLDNNASCDDGRIHKEDFEGDEEVVTVGVTDTTYGITYKVKYSFYPVLSGEGDVICEYVGYDDYYGRMYDTHVELDWCTIDCYNAEGDIGYEIKDVTIKGSKEDMDTFNNMSIEDRIGAFKRMTVNTRYKGNYMEDSINLSDYIFDNVSDLY